MGATLKNLTAMFPRNQLNRPPPQRLPDPVEWERKYGAKPFGLQLEKTAGFVEAAASINTEDWSTLDARKVHQIQAEMDGVCCAVWGTCRLPEETEVFYDPEHRVFVAYPRA